MKRSTLVTLFLILAIIVVVLLLIFISARKRSANDYDFHSANLEQENLIIGDAHVEDISVDLLESFPVQVRVTAYGTLPDGCTEISKVTTVQKGNMFDVAMTTERDRTAVCTDAVRQFEESTMLPVEGLLAGEYLVNVNGIQETFTLPVDNVVDFSEGKK